MSRTFSMGPMSLYPEQSKLALHSAFEMPVGVAAARTVQCVPLAQAALQTRSAGPQRPCHRDYVAAQAAAHHRGQPGPVRDSDCAKDKRLEPIGRAREQSPCSN